MVFTIYADNDTDVVTHSSQHEERKGNPKVVKEQTDSGANNTAKSRIRPAFLWRKKEETAPWWRPLRGAARR